MSDIEEINIESQIETDPRKIDPNMIPQQRRADRWGSFKHPEGHRGLMRYDKFTLQIKAPLDYHGNPIKLPVAFKGIKQRSIATCSEPGGGNVGCPCWTGCPYHGHGPFIAIMKHEEVDVHSPAHCYNIWTGYTPQGDPITQMPMLHNGWKVDTSRRTVPYITTRVEPRPNGGHARIRYAGEYEVKDLGPMYHNTPETPLPPEVRLGEVSLNEALKRWNKPTPQEVAASGTQDQHVAGDAAEGGPSNRRVYRRKQAGGQRVHGSEGNRKGRKRAVRGHEGVVPNDAAPGVESGSEARSSGHLRPSGQVGTNPGGPGAGVPGEGVRAEINEDEFFRTGLREDAERERLEAEDNLRREFQENLDALQGRD